MSKLKTIILTAIITFATTLVLFGGATKTIQTTSAQNADAKSNFISKVRTWAGDYVALDDRGNALKAEYDSLDLGNVLVDGDFIGSNSGYTKAQLVSAISSMGTLHTSYASGHNTNFQKLK